MPVNASDVRQHAQELMAQLGPDQMAAVVQLLEVMVDPPGDGDEPLSEEERRAVLESREYFRQNPLGGVPFGQFAAECGFSMDEILEPGK